MNTLSGEKTVSKMFCSASGKGSALKGKNLLPLGANSLLQSRPVFRRDCCAIEQGRKCCVLCENGGKSSECTQSPKMILQ